MRQTQYYIVRIYRRDEHDSRNVVGFVERVGKQGKQSFAGPEELWKIVAAPGRHKKAVSEDRGTQTKRATK